MMTKPMEPSPRCLRYAKDMVNCAIFPSDQPLTKLPRSQLGEHRFSSACVLVYISLISQLSMGTHGAFVSSCAYLNYG